MLKQDFADFEVIVVDDGSTDGSPSIIESLYGPQIKLIQLERNREHSPRNEALKVARGRYIAFQNSDDIWKPGKLKAQVEILEKYKNVSACFTGVSIIDQRAKPNHQSYLEGVFITDNKTRLEWLCRFFDYGNCLCISSSMVRASSLKKVGAFKPSLVQVSDFDMWVRLASIGEFKVIKKQYTQMRVVTTKNLSYPSPITQRRSAVESIKILQHYIEEPIIGEAQEIFSEFDVQKKQKNIMKAKIAMRAWNLSPAHRFFADQVMNDLMNNPRSRSEVIKEFGVGIIHEFLKKRSELELNVKI